MSTGIMTTSLLACLAAAVVSLAATPPVKKFAVKVGAIDVPKDTRRMHTKPVPRMGGLAIFLGFLVSELMFSGMARSKRMIILGALVIIALGLIDDVVALKAPIKFLVQIGAALIPILGGGLVIERFTNPFSDSGIINLGVFSIPITIIWIVGITNAVNFIDGLDGLACGVSCIASVTLFTIAVIVGEPDLAITMAALAGACLGFLPYNLNPAKIFMGDTGALFLGFILATVSIQGLFKFYAVISFAVPFVILGLPIFDTAFAIVRRVAKGQSPLRADRGHVHHRLIDMGFDQKQSVAILYILSLVLGMLAVLLTASGEAKVIVLVAVVLLSFFIGMSTKLFGFMTKNGHGNGGEGKDDDKN